MILKHGYMTIDTVEFILGKAYVACPVMAHLPNTGTIHGPITGSKKKSTTEGEYQLQKQHAGCQWGTKGLN